MYGDWSKVCALVLSGGNSCPSCCSSAKWWFNLAIAVSNVEMLATVWVQCLEVVKGTSVFERGL